MLLKKIKWILDFSGSCGVTTSLNFDLIAIKYRLVYYNWLEILGTKMLFEFDLIMTLKMILQGAHTLHPHAPLIKIISKGWINNLGKFSWNMLLERLMFV